MPKQIAQLPRTLAAYAVDARKASNCVLTPLDAFDDSLPPVNLIIPFNLDAEYVDNLARIGPIDSDTIEGRLGVTTQIRGVRESVGTIFACTDLATLADQTARELRHPVVEHPCIVVDWLRSRGTDCRVFEDAVLYAKLRKSCRLQVCAHFALADIAFLAGTSEFLETIVDLFKTRKLTMGRRLVARASGHAKSKGGIVSLAPWVIEFGSVQYRLTLEIVDTSGLHGIAGYKTLAANTGIKLDAKDLLSREGVNADITRMDEIYFEKPDEFDAYALGDLYVSDIIYANENLFGQIWDALGIPHRRVAPRLTIGGTVADLLKNRMAEVIGATLDNDIEEFVNATTGNHNAGVLSRYARNKNPLALLSKVDGGRCRNAKPLLTRLSGALCDIDIAGAYASSMTATPLVFGKVRHCSYGNSRDIGNLSPCPSLAEWLRRYEHRLVDRTWYARVSTREPFSFESDLIPSWIGFRVTTALTDSEVVGLDVLTDPNSGEMRYFGKEIYSGTLTSDLLDVARNTMSTAQYGEWSEKIVIRSALYIDKKDYLTPVDYRDAYKTGSLPEYAWTSFTLGELVSDIARANRKKVQKEFGKGSPLDTLYKLVSNTLYGDSVSRHFITSSVISGSNVTGTVRAFMYLAEKALNLVGSITDGQLFDLQRVLHVRKHSDRRRENVAIRRPADIAISTRVYLLTKQELNRKGNARLAPLCGRRLELRYAENDVELEITHADNRHEIIRGSYHVKTWIDDKAYQHLSQLWPNCKMLRDTFRVVDTLNPDGAVKYRDQVGLFRFETKDVIDRASLHGSANYLHVSTDPRKKPTYRMRSFEANREHRGFTLNDQGELTYLDTYVDQSPAKALLDAIDRNSARVPILPPFAKTRILKPGIYSPKPVEGRNHVSRYHAFGVVVIPGDSVFVTGRPRLFSLAQFTFQTRQQYESWKRTTNRLINKHGLSFEPWFTNVDGLTVDYALMLDAIDRAICEGVIDPAKYFDARYRRRLDTTIERYHQATKVMADHLNGRLGADDTVYEDIGFSGNEWE